MDRWTALTLTDLSVGNEHSSFYKEQAASDMIAACSSASLSH